jgi:hypothetical protein
MPEEKVADETHRISKRRGNGLLRREIWMDENGEVTRYNLAYINLALYRGDNGRVLGYDNSHGGHHRHHLGLVVGFDYSSFDELEARFEREWLAIHRQ